MRLFARIILDTRPAGYASLTKNRSGRFFRNHTARGRNISFEDDGGGRMTAKGTGKLYNLPRYKLYNLLFYII